MHLVMHQIPPKTNKLNALYNFIFKNLVNVQALAHFKNKLHKQPSPIIQESGMSGVSKRGELKVLERRHFTNSSREVTAASRTPSPHTWQ